MTAAEGMTPAQKRRALLGDEVIAQIRERVNLAPDPSPELVEELRRIFTNPGASTSRLRPASDAA